MSYESDQLMKIEPVVEGGEVRVNVSARHGYPLERIADVLHAVADKGLNLSKLGVFIPDYQTEARYYTPKQAKNVAKLLDAGALEARVLRSRRGVKTKTGGYFRPPYVLIAPPRGGASEKAKSAAKNILGI